MEGRYVPTLAVDSMQVYRELPVITNQARRRQAELVGIVSVTEEWTVAKHRLRAEEIVAPEKTFVLDAGTGMYLNAILLDFPLAPRVSPALRQQAQEAAAHEPNPRMAARAKELDLAGADCTGWPRRSRETQRRGRGRSEDKSPGHGVRRSARALRAPLGDTHPAAGTRAHRHQNQKTRSTQDAMVR